MDRRCPNCGELVPSLSVTCPRCYSQVPRDDTVPKEKKEYRSGTGDEGAKGKSLMIATLLAAIPGLFGLLGLGRIYLDYKNEKGWFFLVTGAILFTSLLLCVDWWDSVSSFTRVLLLLAMVILAIVYISTYLSQLADTYFGSVFKFFRF